VLLNKEADKTSSISPPLLQTSIQLKFSGILNILYE